MNAADEVYTCHDCGKIEAAFDMLPSGGGASNYATWKTQAGEVKVCATCSAKRTYKKMVEEGKVVLYFTLGKVSDWSGALSFPALYSEGNHNWWHVKRYDIWFRDFDGNPWYGVCMTGGSNQLANCRRVKDSPKFPVRRPQG
jgi:DNA-directed RNA polymerase subunit RPC12/RpoP